MSTETAPQCLRLLLQRISERQGAPQSHFPPMRGEFRVGVTDFSTPFLVLCVGRGKVLCRFDDEGITAFETIPNLTVGREEVLAEGGEDPAVVLERYLRARLQME